MLPYRTASKAVEGVVITFTDVTKRIHAAEALEIAKQQADAANITKSKFLAAASHDLRQPLQTMSLLQGLLAKTVEGENGQKLVARLDDTLTAMSSMLNTLLDINQIDAGIVHPAKTDFPINEFLIRMRDEFSYHAQAKGLGLRVAPCSLWVHSDPRLLEQMVRNLLSNAMKYTQRGRVVIGCRRHARWLSLQVWDTGIGIPEEEFSAIFEEYHQIDNPARERSRGLGLGLSIVLRLGTLLDHRIGLRSTRGRFSMFSIDIPLAKVIEPHSDAAPIAAKPRRRRPRARAAA
jgi:two-component system CheB/CheR fusion protein